MLCGRTNSAMTHADRITALDVAVLSECTFPNFPDGITNSMKFVLRHHPPSGLSQTVLSCVQ